MFYADLHVHSKYSRATSRDGTLANFGRWARRKGLGVVGTGDFTHPAWRATLGEELTPAEAGLFRLRPDLERGIEAELPAACRAGASPLAVPTRFMLQVEISTIYTRDGVTRKVHHIVLVPGFKEADILIAKLGKIGNLKSDGRPILGLDSRHLLELVLEAGDGCLLIPAHIWTPWFSALGSKSGFDAIADCYADLASHVFAVETGLSSDPPMNWRVSSLDRYRLISNSDCHSPQKLGREATVFDTTLDYFAIRTALKTGMGYGGTIEFFPEEGKYHLDGHRNCGIRWEPDETKRHKGICPVCGKAVTVGVMTRVEALADRPEGRKPETAGPFRSFISLGEILGEVLDCGPATGKVTKALDTLVAEVGPEMAVLSEAPVEAIEKSGPPRLGAAIGRMRVGTVIREAGFDGEYGVISLFDPAELGRPPRKRKVPAPVVEKLPRRAGRTAKRMAEDQMNLF